MSSTRSALAVTSPSCGATAKKADPPQRGCERCGCHIGHDTGATNSSLRCKSSQVLRSGGVFLPRGGSHGNLCRGFRLRQMRVGRSGERGGRGKPDGRVKTGSPASCRGGSVQKQTNPMVTRIESHTRTGKACSSLERVGLETAATINPTPQERDSRPRQDQQESRGTRAFPIQPL